MTSLTPDTTLADTVKQHPAGTSIIAGHVTFPNTSVAEGVNIPLLVGLGYPLTASATAIGATTVPPSGIAIFP